jgi:acetyl esterase/lipase
MGSWRFVAGIVCASLLAGFGIAGTARSAEPAATDANSKKPAELEVRAERNITYYTGPGADKLKHRLDLYLPKGRQNFPVVMFVHGGAWFFGDKDFFGAHEAVGRMFAKHGIGAAVISYRLTPQVQHPEHVKDVARAFAWVHANIKKYGGRPDEVFLCGHSAGGHLVALLATDDEYLKAEGLALSDIKGVIPISGVYDLPDNMFTEVFGKDKEVRRKAMPLNDVQEGCPPFLIIYGDKDFPGCDMCSRQFCNALVNKHVTATTLELKRNHIDVLTDVPKRDDPGATAMIDFITKCCAKN